VRLEIEFKGLRELNATLHQLPDTMQGPMIAGLMAGAEVYRQGMAERAPRDPIVAGVTLANEMMAVIKAPSIRDVPTAVIGPSRKAWYARFLEFGTVHSAARPFMRQTLMQDAYEAQDAIAMHLRRGLPIAAERAR
jgi:HK97 gp10 family phage protein